MSAFHEWEANQRYDELLRNARLRDGWRLEGGRLPRPPSLWTWLTQLLQTSHASEIEATRAVASQEQSPVAPAATAAPGPARQDHPKAS